MVACLALILEGEVGEEEQEVLEEEGPAEEADGAAAMLARAGRMELLVAAASGTVETAASGPVLTAASGTVLAAASGAVLAAASGKVLAVVDKEEAVTSSVDSLKPTPYTRMGPAVVCFCQTQLCWHRLAG